MNSFNQVKKKGDLTLVNNFNVFSCRVSSGETGTLVPGQAVKLVDVAGNGVITVEAAADTEDAFGFIQYVTEKNEYVALDMVKIVGPWAVMFMEASAAIAAGASVEAVTTGQKIKTSAGVKPVIGLCLDKATADGDLVRVFVLVPINSTLGNAVTGNLSVSGDATIVGALAAASAAITGLITAATITTTGLITAASLKIVGIFQKSVGASYTAGAGALPITESFLDVQPQGAAEALTLADGAEGQELILKCSGIAAAETAVITPANFADGSTITLDANLESVSLVFANSTWNLVSNVDATIA